MHSLSKRLLRRFMQFFFSQLYHAFAWTYDIVAWIVSLGRWGKWVGLAVDELTGLHVLELGHGPGHLQAILAEKGFRAIGIDSSRQMGRLASKNIRKAGREIQLVRCQAEQLPFGNEGFNHIIATFPSEYISHKDTISEAYRILQPGGSMVILPAAWITGEKWHERFAAWIFNITEQSKSPDNKILQAFEKAGFSVGKKWVKNHNWKVLFIFACKPHTPTQ